jgi:hypothetical protein
VRDLIDEFAGGRVHAAFARRTHETYRDLALAGFAGVIPLQIGTDLLLGRKADRPLSVWETAFLPRVLRQELPQVLGEDGQPIASAPVLVYERTAPPVGQGQPYYLGRLVVLALSGLMLALSLAAIRWRWISRVLRITWGLVGGFLGLLLVGVAAYTRIPMLAENTNLLLLWPFDLALLWLATPHLRRYGIVRLFVIAIVFATLRPPASMFTLATSGVLAALMDTLAARHAEPT